jgi:carbonic anhydrase/acetyltransferase-like protein (isoleucine patch superfamily)
MPSRLRRSVASGPYALAVPIPTTAVKLSGKEPAVGEAGFVAPSANLLGAVTVGQGASVWYASLVHGSKREVEIGEMSSVGDRAVVVDTVVGKYVHIGAGAIVTSAKLGDESSVGMGCKVGKGASLGAGAALAAGSVLRPGAAVPAGQLWGGNPAKMLSDVSAESRAGMVQTAEITAELAKVHMEEAWKDLALVEQDHDDYKREGYRTPDVIAQMREDPKWTPLPTLGEYLTKIGVHSNTHTPP